MTNQDNTQDNKEMNTESNSSSHFRQTLLISFGSAFLTLLMYVIVFEPLEHIRENKVNIQSQQNQIEDIKRTIQVSRQELEAQMQLYIEENYGDVSVRDENIEKLMIYFKAQDARLSNIEEALSKF